MATPSLANVMPFGIIERLARSSFSFNWESRDIPSNENQNGDPKWRYLLGIGPAWYPKAEH